MRSAPQSTGVKGGLVMNDGFASLLSGIGTSQDKNIANRYGFDGRFCASHVDAEAAYRTSWIVRKAHDLPPFDMTREWRRWQADDEQIQALEDEEKRLGLKAKTRLALLYARLYGGGALVLGVKATLGRPEEALDATRLAKGDLEFVHVVSRHQLAYEELDRNPMSPTFMQPKMWTLNGDTTTRIHPTRVVPFIGQPAPYGMATADQFWGDPLLTSIWDAVTNADLVQAIIPALLQEIKTDTLKIPDFMSQVGTAEYEGRFMRRIQLANQAKSIMNTRVIDAAEDWNTQQITLTGLTDIERQKLQIVAAAVDIPTTRFIGESAKGLNATGQGDEDNYNASISSKQENDLQPTLELVLDEALIRSALGSRPDNVSYLWAPLAEVEPKEAAEIEKLEAETAQIYAAEKLVPPDALAKTVQNRLMESGRWPGLEQAIEETEHELDFEPVAEPGAPPANEDDPSALTQDPAKKLSANDAAPRTLYVSRKLLNADDLIAWAKGQGIETTLAGADMHVTVAFSRAPVDWLKMGTDWSGDEKGWLRVPAGGPRVVERLGEDGKALTLAFSNESLEWRHKRFVEAGCSWDWPEYQPHVTISYSANDVDASKLEAYQGPLVFGPEVFAEVKEDWSESISES